MANDFVPTSYSCLRKNYSMALFRKDLLAGISVGIISLPVAMAFGIASGVTPAQGLITAIIAGFLISALGGSRVQIGGPTGAFIVLIYDIVQRTGYAGLQIATLFAGCMLILFALLRLGSWIKYVSYPLITGLTTGIALLLFSSQIKSFFGLPIESVPSHFFDKWAAYLQVFSQVHLPTTILASFTLIGMIAMRRWIPRFPWAVGGIFLATALSSFFSLPVATIRSTFGPLPDSLFSLHWPSLSLTNGALANIIQDGIAIALLGGIESLLSATIGDSMSGGKKHKSNCELLGQGIANVSSSLFGGIPATGAIARTAINVNTGAHTPLSGMIHAITLLILVTFCAPLISYIPMCAMASVLVMIAWNMSELPHFFHLLKAPRNDLLVLLATFAFTLITDVTTAILFGIILSSFLFMKKMSESSKKIAVQSQTEETRLSEEEEIYEIQGPFFFATSHLLEDLLAEKISPPKKLVLRLSKTPFIDASGARALRDLSLYCAREKIPLTMTETHPEVRKILIEMGLNEDLFSHL